MSEPANSNQPPVVLPGPVLPQVNAGQVPTMVGGGLGAPTQKPMMPPPMMSGSGKPKSIEELSLIKIPSQEPTAIKASETGSGTPQQSASTLPTSSASLDVGGVDLSGGGGDIPIQFVGAPLPEETSEEPEATITPSPLPSEAPVVPIPDTTSPPPVATVEPALLSSETTTTPPVAVAATVDQAPATATDSDADPDTDPETADTSTTTTQPQSTEPPTTAAADVATPPSPPPAPAPTNTPTTTTTGPAPTSILDVLVKRGQLTQDQANEILTQNIQTGLNIEHLVEKSGLITEDQLAQARSEFYNIPYVNLNEVGIYPEALAQVPEGVARSYWLLPFSLNKDKNILSVAMRNPLDVQAIDFLEHKTGAKVQAHFAAPSEIERFIAEQYSQSLSTEVTQALEQTKQVQQQKQAQQDFSDLSGGMIRQAPITKIVQTILSFSLKARASDVHIEPQENRTRVRYRIDGILQEKLILPKSVHQAVVSRIKILAGLKIDERRLPQDGRFDFSENNQQVDLRISTLPTIHGEKVVMRLLKKNADVPTLEELGLNGLALRNVQDAIKVPHGIILVTGPTGSGKTTTLYSVLHTINTTKVNIMTLEDPVEYQMPGVNQVQVNPQAGLTFASGLRSFLRQDPNIIMVGEIRDSETAGLAVQASLTGHLVFSTLHTSSASGALPRLMDMGAEPFLLASSMTCVMAQRIVRIINPEYKEPYKPEPSVLEDFKTVLGDNFTRWLQQNQKTENDIMLMRPKKERPESEPEYKGRIAIFEVMKISEEIAKLIMARKASSEMEKVSLRDGMLLMKQDGYLKVLDGITTIEEVLRVAEI